MKKRTSMIDPDRVRDRLVSLVRVPSITGSEEMAIQQIAGWLQDLGAEVDYWYDGIATLQRDPSYPGHEVERAWVPVVAGVLRGERPGPTVLLTGHVDVVPPSDYSKWSNEPFEGLIRGDKLFGCGAADMKAGLVSALEAFETFATGPRSFPGRLIFLAVPAEEDSGLGTLASIRRGWKGDAAIIPEPTSTGGVPSIVAAHAGAMSLTIEVTGRAAHASRRLDGESALDHFIEIYQAMREHEKKVNDGETNPRMKQFELPYATNVGIVSGGAWSSSVMDSLKAEVRIGVALSETVEEAEERFRNAILERTRSDPWLRDNPPKITRKASGFGSAEIPEDHPLVRTLSNAADDLLGSAPAITAAPYGCDMSGWVRLADVPTVIYGPGELQCAHGPDEWVSLDLTTEVSRVLVRTVEELLDMDPETLRRRGAGESSGNPA